jgi:hypothetical protein
MAGRSRYGGAAEATVVLTDPSGEPRAVAYLLPRAPQDAGSGTPLARHRVAADDRIDLVADRYLGDPQAWWRICDANAALDPDALVGPDNEGRVIVIGVPRM